MYWFVCVGSKQCGRAFPVADMEKKKIKRTWKCQETIGTYPVQHFEDFLHGCPRLKLTHPVFDRGGQLLERSFVAFRSGVRVNDSRFNGAPNIPILAPDDPADKIAARPLNILVALNDELVIIVAIVSDPAVSDEVVAHDIAAEPVERHERVHDVAGGFGHFLAPESPVSVGQDLSRQRKVQGEKECRPVYTVETNNVFADDVHVSRPAGAIFSAWDLEGVIGFGEVVD